MKKKCIFGHIKYNFIEFVLTAVVWRSFQQFMQKHRKWTARLPLSAGCFLIAQAGFFIWCTTTVGLYWGIIILLKFHVPSRDFSVKVLHNFVVYESAVDRNLRTIFNRVKNSLSCNILPNTIVTGMPYLPAKGEFVSLNRLSSRELWKWYNSKVFDRWLYGVGQHFTFSLFSRKRKLFAIFDCDFRKYFTKGFFWLNMKNLEISVLTANSRYLQTAALKYFSFPKSWIQDFGWLQHYSFPGYGIQDFGWLQPAFPNLNAKLWLSCLFPANFNYVNVFSLFSSTWHSCDAVGHKI